MNMNAQENNMKINVFASIPMGDWGDFYSFGAGADFQYLFEVGNDFYAGPMASLLWYSGKDLGGIKDEDAMFLPIGGTARYTMEEFFVGADLGYGIGLAPAGMGGGFYFKPKVGYSFGSIAAVASYSMISNVGTVSAINLGVEFSL